MLPVQLRQFMPAGAVHMPAAAAVDSNVQLIQLEGASASGGSSDHSSSSSNAAAGLAEGVVAVSRFASYAAAAGELPLPLLRVVRELLYGQSS